MATGGALQHLVDYVKDMDAKFFSTSTDSEPGSTTNQTSGVTSYLGERVSIANGGYSSGTTQRSQHYVVHLGGHQPDYASEFNIWVDNAKEDDPAANKVAVIEGLETLIKGEAWRHRNMVSTVPA